MPQSAILRAKRILAPEHGPEAWTSRPEFGVYTTECGATPDVAVLRHRGLGAGGEATAGNGDDSSGGGGDGTWINREITFRDNTERVPFAPGRFDENGDNLPEVPVVLAGACSEWAAFADPGRSWSAETLAARAKADCSFSLDGGPAFARLSLAQGTVPMAAYWQYCEEDAASDTAPLYIFDPEILTRRFADGARFRDEYEVPACFAADVMAGCTGSQFRPLPPAWLLVGTARSGTPIHDHPLTVAWNALLAGCKLWVALPPDIDPACLLLDTDDDFDLSALQWFWRWEEEGLPPAAKVIVQHPGEIVFVPAGWFHVVLNISTSTAISHSLALRRDLDRVFPPLRESDPAFAEFWLGTMGDQLSPERKAELMAMEAPPLPPYSVS